VNLNNCRLLHNSHAARFNFIAEISGTNLNIFEADSMLLMENIAREKL